MQEIAVILRKQKGCCFLFFFFPVSLAIGDPPENMLSGFYEPTGVVSSVLCGDVSITNRHRKNGCTLIEFNRPFPMIIHGGIKFRLCSYRGS